MASTPFDRLAELGIQLPPPPAAAGAYAPVVEVGNLAFVSGQLSTGPEGDLVGAVGADVGVEEGRAAARVCGLNLLSQLQATLGDLNRVERIVRVCGFIRSAGEARLPAVLDGCSHLLIDVFGEAGRHARSVLGVSDLPRDCTVEIEAVVAVREAVERRSRAPRTRADAHQFARTWLEQLNAGRAAVLEDFCSPEVRFLPPEARGGVAKPTPVATIASTWRAFGEGRPRALRDVIFDPVWTSLAMLLDGGGGPECAILRFGHDGLVHEIELIGSR